MVRRTGGGYCGITWDGYYLYGPDATWEDSPSPLIGSGGTIYAEQETLRTQLNALLGEEVKLHSNQNDHNQPGYLARCAAFIQLCTLSF